MRLFILIASPSQLTPPASILRFRAVKPQRVWLPDASVFARTRTSVWPRLSPRAHADIQAIFRGACLRFFRNRPVPGLSPGTLSIPARLLLAWRRAFLRGFQLSGATLSFSFSLVSSRYFFFIVALIVESIHNKR